MKPKEKQKKIYLRKRRVRAKIDKQELRVSVFRSLKAIYAQIIDDKKGRTLASASSLELTKGKSRKISKLELARETGKLLAKKAQQKKIKKVVFDRGPYKYHGRVKALAEGAREGGLKF